MKYKNRGIQNEYGSLPLQKVLSEEKYYSGIVFRSNTGATHWRIIEPL